MRHIDFSPLYRSAAGFDRVNQLRDSSYSATKQDNYPPYNIEKTDENNYLISIAVAGFSEEQVEIEVERNVLRVSGKKESEETETEILYRGIANRNFQKQFQLDEQIKVVKAEMNSGMLTIKLQRVLPEHLKSRKIEIQKDSSAALHAA